MRFESKLLKIFGLTITDLLTKTIKPAIKITNEYNIRFLDGVVVSVFYFRYPLAVALDSVEEALNVSVDVDHLVSE